MVVWRALTSSDETGVSYTAVLLYLKYQSKQSRKVSATWGGFLLVKKDPTCKYTNTTPLSFPFFYHLLFILSVSLRAQQNNTVWIILSSWRARGLRSVLQDSTRPQSPVSDSNTCKNRLGAQRTTGWINVKDAAIMAITQNVAFRCFVIISMSNTTTTTVFHRFDLSSNAALKHRPAQTDGRH